MEIVDFQDTIENPVLNDDTKGFVDGAELSSYRENYTLVSIPKGMEYRPDLISMYYYGTTNNAWLITYANDFDNGVKDYIAGRRIKIPNIS